MIGSVTVSRKLGSVLARHCAALGGLFLSCDHTLHQFVSRFAEDKDKFVVFGKSVAVSIGSLILAAAIALIFYLTRSAIHRWYNYRLRVFFGVDREHQVKFIIPSYRCVGNESGIHGSFGRDAFHEQGSDMFFKRNPDQTLRYKKAFQSPICVATDVNAYFFAIRMLGPKGLDFRFEIDEDFININRMLPRTKAIDGEAKCIICFGSDSSNYAAGYLSKIPFFNDNPETYSFVSTNSLIKNSHKRRRPSRNNDTTHLFSNESTDYAVIAKLKIDENTFFLCAGIDQAGSIVATQILLDNWKELLQETKGDNFFYLYEVNRHALRPEELYEERNVAKPIHKYVDKTVGVATTWNPFTRLARSTQLNH